LVVRPAVLIEVGFEVVGAMLKLRLLAGRDPIDRQHAPVA